MVTAQQKSDLDRLLRMLNPNGLENDEFITLLTDILTTNAESVDAIGGSEASVVAADVTYNNDATLADVAGLVTSSLAVGRKYYVEGVLILEAASVTPDMDIKFIGSANSTLDWGVGGLDGSVLENTIATTLTIALAAGIQLVAFKGVLDIVDTAGTLKIQAAQNVATAENTTVKAGSFMKITRVE